MAETQPRAGELRDRLEALARQRGADVFGVASMASVREMPAGLPLDATFFDRYKTAIVLGARYDAAEGSASGGDVSMRLERAAFAVCEQFESLRRECLIIHTEDEFDRSRRAGLLPLKALAKEAGLGWQGRSLLAISSTFGPLHRVIAVLNDVELPIDRASANRCGTCSACVDACPVGALSLVEFEDHPESRDQVLDVRVCLGDDGCVACIEACPWLTRSSDPGASGTARRRGPA